MPQHPPVLVVGAGPVGLVLANELARRQVPFRVIDKLAAPTDESRAIIVQARSLEMFERIGVADAVRGAGIETRSAVFHDEQGVVAEIEFGTVDSPYPYSISIAQTETERILTERLAALGGKIERGVELVTFAQDGDGAQATLRHPDGSEERATFGWIAGTDGSHSTVRDVVGTKLDGSFKGERFLIGDVEADYDYARDAMHAFFAAGGPVLLFPMLGDRVRVIAQVQDEEESTLPRLQAIVDERVGGLRLRDPHWLTSFEIHHAQVPRYRFGRAFLAGDAAHVHSPAAAQGMNTGMQDAFNLGWKLALAATGTPCETLLDSYHAERHPVAAKVIESTTALTHAGTLPHALERKLRDHAMHAVTALAPVQHALAAAAEETDIAYRKSAIVAAASSHAKPRPGEAAPDVPGLDASLTAAVGAADGVPLHKALAAGTGHTLLVVAPADAAATPVDVPADLPAGAGLRQIAAGPTADGAAFAAALPDPGRRIAERYGLGDAGGIVVVRPDGYVGARTASGDAASVAKYLAALTG